ncbi:hypothetical protein [Dyella sp.]|uniref:pirin family protein n=1 Tax=Dyella sp. TaxID=1869338 RepID=UPI002ED02E5E
MIAHWRDRSPEPEFFETHTCIARLYRGHELAHLADGVRKLWLHVGRGAETLDGTGLDAGDGVTISAVDKVRVRADTDAGELLFDMTA